MTDDETERTAELLRALAETASVVVVEHDMDFVRALGVKVTVLHEGACWPKARSTRCRDDPRVDRSLSRALSRCSSVQNVNLYYGGSHSAARRRRSTRRIGQVTCLLGRNGVGKTTLLRAIMGLLPIASGTITFDGQDVSQAAARTSARGSASATCRRAARSSRS